MIVGMDDRLRLRPVAEDELPILQRLTLDPEAAGQYSWYGWFDKSRWQRRWDDNELIGDDLGMLMVARGPDALGFVQWRRKRASPAAWYLELGIALLPEFRGKGYGTQAHSLLASYLFAHTTVHRIEAATELENLAEQRALEKAGFTREGVLREIGWRDGAWRDGVIYSLLRTDPPPRFGYGVTS
jgi:RimJ/RimL family protein N-acetyltransferase